MSMNETSTMTAWDENETLMRSIVNEYINDMNMGSQSKSEIIGICSLKIEEFKRQRFSFPSFNELNKRFLEEMCQHVQRISSKTNTNPVNRFNQNDSIQLIHDERSQQLNLRMKEKVDEINKFDTPPPKDIDFLDKSDISNKSIDSLLEEEMKRRDHDFIPPTKVESEPEATPWDDDIIREKVNQVNIKDEVSKLFKNTIEEEKRPIVVDYQHIQTESFPTRSILKRSPEKQCTRWLLEDNLLLDENNVSIREYYMKYVFNRLFNNQYDSTNTVNIQIHSLVIQCNEQLSTLHIKDVTDELNTSVCIREKLMDNNDAIYKSTICTEMSFDKIKDSPPFIKIDCKYPIQKIYAHITFSKIQ